MPSPTSPPEPKKDACLLISRTDAEVEKLFHELAAQWRLATRFQSSLEGKVINHFYQRIIGLGPQVVPFILQELDKAPDHWFWALVAITGEDHAAGHASVHAAAEAWVSWGCRTGLIEGR